MKTIIHYLPVFLLLFSCSKNQADKDTVLPLVIITDPQNNQVFNPGDNISIRGVISDDKYLAEIHVHVTNTNTGALLMDVHIYPNGTQHTLDQSISAAAGVNYKIQVIAKDRSANQSTATLLASCI